MSTIPSKAELRDLEQALGKAVDLDNETVYEKFHKSMRSKPVHDAASHAISDLKKTVRSIEESFLKIREDLQRFDSEGFRGKEGGILQLSSDWVQLHETFDKILETSRDNATKAAAFMRQFTRTMLEDVEETGYAALKEELGNFMERLAEKEKSAGEARMGFSKLADDVRVFGGRIPLVLEDADEHVKEQIDATQLRIDELHDRLQHISDETRKTAGVCVASFAMAALGVGLAIVTLSPEAFVLAISSLAALGGSSSQLVNLVKENKDVKKQLKGCNDEMTRLMEGKNNLNRYKASLKSTQSDISELSLKITTFVTIWQSLKVDLHSFNEQLDYAINPGSKITKLFLKKIANTRELYKKLIFLLEKYAKNADDDYDDDETLYDSDDDFRTAME